VSLPNNWDKTPSLADQGRAIVFVQNASKLKHRQALGQERFGLQALSQSFYPIENPPGLHEAVVCCKQVLGKDEESRRRPFRL
jgi:hypothetical protein